MPDHLCNLIVQGAAKSGTSTLHSLLNQNPQICMSSEKEPHYFCRKEKYRLGPREHNALFKVGSEDNIKFYGESSTGYLPWPNAIEKIQRDLTNPKIIIILRHPVERTFLHYRWRYRWVLKKGHCCRRLRRMGTVMIPLNRIDTATCRISSSRDFRSSARYGLTLFLRKMSNSVV